MNLIYRINQAIDVEYDSKNQEIDEQLNLPIEELVKAGEALADVKAEFIPAINLLGQLLFQKVKIKCKENHSKFRPGTPVLLKGHGHTFELEILEDNGNELVLKVGWQFQELKPALNNKEGWNITNAKVDIRHIVKKTTAILANNPNKYRFLNGIFEGQIVPKLAPNQYEKGLKIAKATPLNTTQQLAFASAYATENYFLIQGPPGTGKTWLLAHLALEFAKEGKKVLITASTHTAINNALQKTAILSSSIPIIKVGKDTQTDNLDYQGARVQNFEDFSQSGYSNSSRGLIVGATCYAPLTRKLEFMDWDVVIIDEAGQLSIPLAMAAMVKGSKYILIGDHKQLPPIISDKHDDPTFAKSIFEHLSQFSKGIMLDTTYRMNTAINAFPSQQFYNGQLKPAPQNENWILDIDKKFERHQDILNPELSAVLVCHRQNNVGPYSTFEANLIADLVSAYLSKGISPSEIAIITPLRAQVREINRALAQLANYEQAIKPNLFVDTVERMQGQERDVIIFSLTISDPNRAHQRVEFFFNPNRLNVALTRARKKRIVLGHKELFSMSGSENSDFNHLLELFRQFYQTSHKIELN
jgi:DNA replication ATP-dependent helicase Dna2